MLVCHRANASESIAYRQTVPKTFAPANSFPSICNETLARANSLVPPTPISCSEEEYGTSTGPSGGGTGVRKFTPMSRRKMEPSSFAFLPGSAALLIVTTLAAVNNCAK